MSIKLEDVIKKYNDDNKENNSGKKTDASSAISTLANSSIFEGDNVNGYHDRMAKAVDCLTENEKWRVSVDTDGDGEYESLKLADAIADSFDSELDLYIQEQVNKIMDKYGTCSKSYLGESAVRELALKGIRVVAVGDGDSMTNRTYSFSLIDVEDDIKKLMQKENLTEEEKTQIYNAVYDDDAKVMQDANGKKGSYIFADCLIPDGFAQGAEINLSSILDQMGYDCISKADFVGHESEYWEVINAVENNIYEGVYDSEATLNEIYGSVKDAVQSVQDLWGGHGGAPGAYAGGDASELGADNEITEAIEEIQDDIKREQLIKEKVEEYKAAHNDEEPSDVQLSLIEKEVDRILSTQNKK